ncbi:MAG: GNAT family N-acetyltransferase [Firmicutes bacterium]|nr:GNAT family N-acetyltransferase [Bacillota bacterium]MCM1401457.1 GNAT family N-acetyltransferase [Bacteroides sp.]MCM1476815.1 GNAT family N-acetyltransferase [Bacteroides sp.]
MNQEIIPPVPLSLLKAELTADRLLRVSNRAGNEIYVVDGREAPNVMREIGRLREIAFRAGGGGTGKDCDIDEFDLMDTPCKQLIVWNPESQQIIGGYRYITGRDIAFLPDGTPRIATAHMFRFSERFLREYLPNTIELGRSFVRLEYQSTRAGNKAVYTLDNLWDGLGALTVIHPDIKYFFGKVTMYPGYARECRNMILYFLNRHFPDPDNLVRPITPLVTDIDTEAMARIFTGKDFHEDYAILHKAVRSHGLNIPPLVNAYMSLSPTMRVFGTAVNTEFGDVEETGIFIAFSEILEAKKRRHIDSYQP